jgi:hypothetical protein
MQDDSATIVTSKTKYIRGTCIWWFHFVAVGITWPKATRIGAIPTRANPCITFGHVIPVLLVVSREIGELLLIGFGCRCPITSYHFHRALHLRQHHFDSAVSLPKKVSSWPVIFLSEDLRPVRQG